MNSFSDVKISNSGVFARSRCYLEGFDKRNDRGIRCYSKIIALVLKLFFKIESIKTDEGKTIYLNKKSLENWLNKHWNQMEAEAKPLDFPSANEILEYYRNKKKTKEPAGKAKDLPGDKASIAKELESKVKERNEDLAAVKIQRITRGFLARKRLRPLKGLKIEINSLEEKLGELKEKIKEKQQQIKVYEESSEAEKKKEEIAKSELEELKKLIAGHEQQQEEKQEPKVEEVETPWYTRGVNWARERVKAFDEKLTFKPKKNEADPLVDQMSRVEEEIDLYVDQQKNNNESIERLKEELTSLNEEVEEITQKIKEKDTECNIILDSVTKPVQMIAPQNDGELKPEAEATGTNPETTSPPPPREQMLSDLNDYCHPKVKELMQTFLDKFPDSQKQGEHWKFEKDTGKFRFSLKEPLKLWVPKKDKETPKGVVLIMGGTDARAVEGTLQKKKIEFTNGFLTYCPFEKFGYKGAANGKINKFEIKGEANDIKVVTYSKGTKIGFPSVTKYNENENSFESALRCWNGGEVVKGDPVKYCKDK